MQTGIRRAVGRGGWAAAIVAFVVLVWTAGAGAQEHVDAALARMRVVDMDGATWTAERLVGRVTLIDFWATWCAPCLTDLPRLKEARARYGRDEFEILGVSVDVSDRRTFVSWINRQAVAWPQVFDGRGRQGAVPRHFRVTGVPATILVGADGRVAAMHLRGERLLAAIEAEVEKRRILAPAATPAPPPAASTPPARRS